jgi:threonine dehydratase
MLEDEPGLVVVATPVGGGGLLSGSAIAAKSRNPSIKVIGVEPALADDAYQSWKAGSIQSLQVAPKTIADGVRTTAISTRTFEVMFANSLVDEIVTVTEDEIASAVRIAWTRLHIALEPTGALPLAAYLTGKLPAGGLTGLILSGGNANLETVAKLLGTP